jgi:hypothetical protein
MNKIKIVYISIIIFFLLSCNSEILKNSDKSAYEYDFEFDKYEPYLNIDSVYKTKEEKLKFEVLKQHFLKIWLKPYDYDEKVLFRIKLTSRPDGFTDEIDPDICYYHGSGNTLGNYGIRKVYIENILHTKNFDTLLFLVVTDEAIIDSNGKVEVGIFAGKEKKYERIRGNLIKVLVKNNGDWEFVCKPILYGHSASPYTDENLFVIRRSVKRSVIKASYFKSDLSIDSTFWYRLFTYSQIYFPDPRKDGFPLH